MYFLHFPKVEYDVKGDGITTKMVDITRRARISESSIMILKILRNQKILHTSIMEMLTYIGLF